MFSLESDARILTPGLWTASNYMVKVLKSQFVGQTYTISFSMGLRSAEFWGQLGTILFMLPKQFLHDLCKYTALLNDVAIIIFKDRDIKVVIPGLQWCWHRLYAIKYLQHKWLNKNISKTFSKSSHYFHSILFSHRIVIIFSE